MQQRMSVLTIVADNLSAMKNFYVQILGWQPVVQNKDIVFFKLNGFLLSICERKMLADFIGVSPNGNGFRCVTIGYNVETKEEVWHLYNQIKNKVTILKNQQSPLLVDYFFISLI